MSLRYHAKHAAVLAAVACLFAVPDAGAIEANNGLELASAFSAPVSAPCHPALGACTKQPQRSVTFANGSAMIAYQDDAPVPDPASAPCHPALKACPNWKRAAR